MLMNFVMHSKQKINEDKIEVMRNKTLSLTHTHTPTQEMYLFHTEIRLVSTGSSSCWKTAVVEGCSVD